MTEPTERTLVLIKPDAVKRRLIGEILSRIERKGLTVAAMQLQNVSDERARSRKSADRQHASSSAASNIRMPLHGASIMTSSPPARR